MKKQFKTMSTEGKATASKLNSIRPKQCCKIARDRQGTGMPHPHSIQIMTAKLIIASAMGSRHVRTTATNPKP